MTSQPSWTILIPTLGQREALFRRLLDRLLPQTVPFEGRVKVRAWWNNGVPPLAEIRQGLVQSVDTDYLSFIDDDDMVPEDFVSMVMRALVTRPDYVGWWVRYFSGGQDREIIDHSLRHGKWSEDRATGRLVRDISHINPMLTSVAKLADFRTARPGRAEDRPWVDQIRATGLLRTQVYIPAVMYEYRWDKGVSAWRRPQQIRKNFRRPEIVHSHFSWHDERVASPAQPGRLAVIVPTRGRPDNIRKVIAAWDETGTWEDADLHLAVDQDDPEFASYQGVEREHRRPGLYLTVQDAWTPMVPKLDAAARWASRERDEDEYRYTAIGFAGDDHLPRTPGWARRYLDTLAEMGVGMVYGHDGYQGRKLATEWAVSAEAVRVLGKMVPAPVEHLYCDNAMMDLYGGAGAMRHLPDVTIEHMHPVAGKSARDEQYDRVNSREQYSTDREAYRSWRRTTMPTQIRQLKALRTGRTPVLRTERTLPRERRIMRGSGPKKIERSGPRRGINAPPKSKFPFPASFRSVEGATPDEIAFTLADLAKQVPADQEIVELGVYRARTALIMAWGAGQGYGAHVTAIDPWDLPGNVYDPPFTDVDSRQMAHWNVNTTGYGDRVELIQDFSHAIAEAWNPEVQDKPVGLLYVDGDHTKEGARRDIEAWAPHLAAGAVIAVDDYGHPDWPGVGEAVDELVEEGFLAPIELHHDRLAVTRINRRPEQFAPDGVVHPSVTAITSEGVEPAPQTDDLAELRQRARDLGVPRAGVMGRDRLIEEIAKLGGGRA